MGPEECNYSLRAGGDRDSRSIETGFWRVNVTVDSILLGTNAQVNLQPVSSIRTLA